METTTKTTVVAVVLFCVGFWLAVGAGIAAVWLTGEIRVFGLVMFPAAIVGALQFLYFNWRATLLDRTSDGRDEHREAA